MRELGLDPCQPKPWRFSLAAKDGQAGDIDALGHPDVQFLTPNVVARRS